MSETRNTKLIKASPESVFQAFINPAALEHWLVPGTMTGKVHHFDLRPGGGYEMSLYYPDSDQDSHGKTSSKEDKYFSRFVEITPFKKIVQAIDFDSTDPAFAGEMIMEVTLEEIADGTNLIIVFRNIPPGIRAEDNEEGTESSLEKLKAYLES